MDEPRQAAAVLCDVVSELTSSGCVPNAIAARLVSALAELLRAQDSRMIRLERKMQKMGRMLHESKTQQESAMAASHRKSQLTKENSVKGFTDEGNAAESGFEVSEGKKSSALERERERALAPANLIGSSQHENTPILRSDRSSGRSFSRRRSKRPRRETPLPAPPCERCKSKKREMMIAATGYVKEKVFERWSKKPGACLEFMHQDEPVEHRDPYHDLSFPESETESPRPSREGSDPNS